MELYHSPHNKYNCAFHLHIDAIARKTTIFCAFGRLVILHKVFIKISVKITKIFLDMRRYYCYINGARVRKHRRIMRRSGRLLRNEVTFVEYVRCRLFPAHNRAAEAFPTHAYIARTGGQTGSKGRFVFRTRPDTHGSVYRNYGLHPYA